MGLWLVSKASIKKDSGKDGQLHVTYRRALAIGKTAQQLPNVKRRARRRTHPTPVRLALTPHGSLVPAQLPSALASVGARRLRLAAPGPSLSSATAGDRTGVANPSQVMGSAIVPPAASHPLRASARNSGRRGVALRRIALLRRLLASGCGAAPVRCRLSSLVALPVRVRWVGRLGSRPGQP